MTCYFCLITAEGTLVRPYRWNGPRETLPRFHEIQMYDEAAQPLPQPYPDPEAWIRQDETDWIIDLWNLPGGWQLIELTQAQWEETQVHSHMKWWDGSAIVIREGFEPIPGREKFHSESQRKMCRPQQGLDIAHIMAGGRPCFRVKHDAGKTEIDFPTLTFTHKNDERIVPLGPEERLTAALKNVALLALAIQRMDDG